MAHHLGNKISSDRIATNVMRNSKEMRLELEIKSNHGLVLKTQAGYNSNKTARAPIDRGQEVSTKLEEEVDLRSSVCLHPAFLRPRVSISH